MVAGRANGLGLGLGLGLAGAAETAPTLAFDGRLADGHIRPDAARHVVLPACPASKRRQPDSRPHVGHPPYSNKHMKYLLHVSVAVWRSFARISNDVRSVR